MTTNRIRIPVIAATGAAAIALAACSSSGSSLGGANSTAAAPPPATGSTQQQVGGNGTSETATETEFHIALSSKRLKPGTYTFHVKNAGSIIHVFTVDGPGVKDKSTGDVSPASSGTVTVTLKAGSYEIYCSVGNHKMEGMDETVQVA
ncbi:MAG: hypothetical protein ACR2LX_14645 [Jatrophihabitans sp.]